MDIRLRSTGILTGRSENRFKLCSMSRRLMLHSRVNRLLSIPAGQGCLHRRVRAPHSYLGRDHEFFRRAAHRDRTGQRDFPRRAHRFAHQAASAYRPADYFDCCRLSDRDAGKQADQVHCEWCRRYVGRCRPCGRARRDAWKNPRRHGRDRRHIRYDHP